jgi:proteasome lid subunit RPN8/RPN11
MDERWTSVFKSWLQFPEEVGAVILSPRHAEIWKGTAVQCPYFKNYQNKKVVIVHSHPSSPDRKYNPPSSTDLLNCIVSPNPHIVVAQEGFWMYSPTKALREEWSELSLQQQEELGKVIANNTFGLSARLIGGNLLNHFAENVDRTELSVQEYVQNMTRVIPRKDPSLPSLGFKVEICEGLPVDGILFDDQPQILGYEWNIEHIESLTSFIEEASPGQCIASDGSIVTF